MSSYKDIPGYEELYAISNNGEIFSYGRTIIGKDGKIYSNKPQWLKFSKHWKGYHEVNLSKNGVSKSFKVHRLVALTFIKNDCIEKNQINHKNGIKTDNRVENLEWVTNKENSEHSWNSGLHKNIAKGEKIANSKLKEADVRFIRENYSLGPAFLSRKFKVNTSVIHKIRRKEIWRHVI